MNRRIAQILGAVIPNLHIPAFLGRLLYKGPLKGFCVPVLNCYACPLALSSCPIGSIQHFARIRQFPFYVLGYLVLIGLFVGRWTCGWLCPFGFLQDLMYKIKSFKIRIPYLFRYLKYGWLVIAALLLPYLTGEMWFSKLCPQGTFQAGIPLILASQEIRNLVGGFFWLKIAILGIFLFLFVISKRPFCVTMCPLGAIYSLFNRLSLVTLKLNNELCSECEFCVPVCPMGLKSYKELEHPDCIRCMECKKACPEMAIRLEIRKFGTPILKIT